MIFNQNAVDATKEPMFFGEPVNISRFDVAKYPTIAKLTETQIGFFWRAGEVDLTKDASDFAEMPEHAKRIFQLNLQYQELLDSVQGRSPSWIFGATTSLPEIESFSTAWSFVENNLHSHAYTHILKNVHPTNPSGILDQITQIPEIMERATEVTKYLEQAYDVCIIKADSHSPTEKRKALLLALMATNILEGLRFYVSFACSFAFAESGVMEGNAKVIKLIARDEAVHLAATQFMLNTIRKGSEGPEWKADYEELVPTFQAMYRSASEQEKDWAKFLFKGGPILGLNAEILSLYVDYLTASRMNAIKLPHDFGKLRNPINWINSWFGSGNIQEAPQETEKESYVIGGIDLSVSEDDAEELNNMQFD